MTAQRTDTQPDRARWLGVVAVAAGICTVVTAEQLPIGLLTQISDGLGESKGTLGTLVTVPGFVAALSAPLVPLAARRLDRRLLLAGLIAVLVAANVVSALAPSFAVLMLARVFIGVTIGGFWAVAAGLATRLVPREKVARATAVVFGGVAAGNVLGTPASTLFGGIIGWRPAFAALAGAALLVGAALVVGLPRLPAQEPVRLAALGAQLRRPAVRAGLLVTVLVVVGQFVAFTYVSPIIQNAGFAAAVVGLVLVGYGVAGMVGNSLVGAAVARAVRPTVLGITVALPVAMALVALFAVTPVVGAVLVVAWGLVYGGVSVGLQSWTLDAAPDAVEPATALWVAAFNLSISIGALAGGPILDATGVPVVLAVGAVVVLLAAVPATWSIARHRPERSDQASRPLASVR